MCIRDRFCLLCFFLIFDIIQAIKNGDVTLLKSIGNRLRALRKSRHLTQEDMSQILHVCRQTYSNYEAGIRTPSLDSLIFLAQYFHVTLDFLLCSDSSVYSTQTTPCLSMKKEFVRLSHYERRILKITQELSSDEQEKVMAFLCFIKEHKDI